MLTVYRSNRAEWLAKVLSEQLRLTPPKPLETIDVVVNTWPTSRWLGEQLSKVNKINALVKFPFPGSHLRKLAQLVIGDNHNDEDPWKARRLVWPLIEVLPEFLKNDEAAPLREWLQKQSAINGEVSRAKWQLIKNIADVFDDYALYRPELLKEWQSSTDKSFKHLSPKICWQPLLLDLLIKHIEVNPFAISAKQAIQRLIDGESPLKQLPDQLYIFGLSSLAPVQVELIQALSGLVQVKIFLLTPCPDLWHRCKHRREKLCKEWEAPFDGRWLLEASQLEANIGRMGSEFQQLLEGSGECQLGQWEKGDLFAAPANIACQEGRNPTLIEQIQQQLVIKEKQNCLFRTEDDNSLIFMACPGQLRQIQLVRDHIIQLLAKDDSLEPKDILIMTPQTKELTPIIASVFNDISATGVNLPWCITDNDPIENSGITKYIFKLLEIAEKRFTATDLDSLISNNALQVKQGLSQMEVNNISRSLNATGFRWGLDSEEREGDETHSLSWCLDRWLLGLVLPTTPEVAPKGIAPFANGISPAEVKKWWEVLSALSNEIRLVRQSHTCRDWIELLKGILQSLVKNTNRWDWEYQSLLDVFSEWYETAGNCQSNINANVVVDILQEALLLGKKRFGHRSGKITISALEPMRAIPYRVIILMGLDADIFPRYQNKPSFNLLLNQRRLGDPKSSDQDRYVILEALMSTRQHLMITWNCRREKTGDFIHPSNPVQQWIDQLKNELNKESFKGLFKSPSPNPIARSNFLSLDNHEPISCDRRNFQARKWADKEKKPSQIALGIPLVAKLESSERCRTISNELLKKWLIAPQLVWLDHLHLHPREWIDPINDFDTLDLNELERYSLFNEQFENLIDLLIAKGTSTTSQIDGDWKYQYQGKGYFPPKGAGSLEISILESRWQNLKSILLSLGPCKKCRLELDEGFEEFLIAGDYAPVIEIGRLKAKSVMRGWLNHLQICSYSKSPISTIVIARSSNRIKNNNYNIELKWKVIEKDKAKEYLQILKDIAINGIYSCWPVPPESGWARASKSSKKSKDITNRAFQQKWDGDLHAQGERYKSEMILCFGNTFESHDFFVNDEFHKAFSTLYEPIINTLID